MKIKAGEHITLPCRQCASVSLEVRVTPGKHLLACPKCGTTNTVEITREPAGFRFRSSPVEETPRSSP